MQNGKERTNNLARALVGKEAATAAMSAPPKLKKHFKVEVKGEKVFFQYPKPIVLAVGEKKKQTSIVKEVLRPRYLLSL